MKNNRRSTQALIKMQVRSSSRLRTS